MCILCGLRLLLVLFHTRFLSPHALAKLWFRARCNVSSEAYKRSHAKGDDGEGSTSGGGRGLMSKLSELVLEPPDSTFYDAVLVQPTPPEHKGGLWEFENEPSYFDGDT